MAKKLVGAITHYYGGIGVAVVELSAGLKKGERISIEGATSGFEQTAESMEDEKKPVDSASKGQSIGLKVSERCRVGDKVYVVEED